MPDAKSQLVGYADIESDAIAEIVTISTPIHFRITNRFAGRLAKIQNATEMMADSRQLKRELTTLVKKSAARAA